MAITIDARGVEGGLNYETYLAEFYSAVGAGMTSSPRGDGDWIEDQQVSFNNSGQDEMILLDGTFSYDFIASGPQAGHDISGSLESVTFGRIDADTDTTAGEVVTGLDAGLVVSGLDVTAGAFDTPNAVYQLYSLLRAGGATPANIAAIYAAFATDAQTFIGSKAADAFTGGAFDDRISGNRGGDALAGGAGDDNLRGDNGDDTLAGGDGADLLFGGAGNDRLFGGEGDDTFVLGLKDVGDRDRVRDFAAGDRIDLSAFDASFIGGDDFSGEGAEVRLEGNVLTADVDGDGAADLAVRIRGDAVTESDLLF